MTISLTSEQARLLRIRAQQLSFRQSVDKDGRDQVARVAGDLCGVQSQDVSAAGLAIRGRCKGLVREDFERALFEERIVVRTWLMRGTLHLVPAEDLNWILALLAPRFIRLSQGRRNELGLDEETGEKGVQFISILLTEQGPMTRKEIAWHLEKQGIPTAGQAIIHLISLAALEGVLCYGPDREGQETFILLKDYVDRGRSIPDEQAQVELARRYLAAYAPAAPEDFAAWSGMRLGSARKAWGELADRLLDVSINGEQAWMLQAQLGRLDELVNEDPVVNLLPRFDPYLLGYKNRHLSVPQPYAKRIYPGGGTFKPALLVDGLAAGTWKIKRKRNDLAVMLEPFEKLSDDVISALESEVEELGRYYAMHATMKLAQPGN